MNGRGTPRLHARASRRGRRRLFTGGMGLSVAAAVLLLTPHAAGAHPDHDEPPSSGPATTTFDGIGFGPNGPEWQAMLFGEPPSGTGLQSGRPRQVDAKYTGEPISGVATTAATPCVNGSAGGFPCNNVDLLAHMPLNTIGGGSGNDIWGWTDPQTGTEYALMGRSNGTAFVDISDPENPVYVGNLPTATFNSSWRDIKVHDNHAYVVSEASGHGLQVFDLTRLRNVTNPPVTFTADARNTSFGNAHNIAINEDSGFAYVIGSNTCAGGPRMFDLAQPTNPVFAGCVSQDGYTHDTQGVIYQGPDPALQGRELLFSSNENSLTVVDVTTKSSPNQLARVGYPGLGYTHQGWLTEDHRYFLLDDELDEVSFGHNTRTRVFDVQDPSNPTLIGIYEGPTSAIDHNLYIVDDVVYQANYTAGLRILDISDTANPASWPEVAFFDVHPANDNPTFNGAWSNYPFFDSGVVIVSSIEGGLFILQPTLDDEPQPPAGEAVFEDDFESDQGWTVDPNGTDTATEGLWERAVPQETSWQGAIMQRGDTPSGAQALVTGALAGSSVGSHDIDDGVTSVASPAIALPTGGSLELSFQHYLAHLTNATSDDFLRVSLVSGSSTTTVFEELGAGTTRPAVWTGATVDISSHGGQTVQILIEAADDAGPSLVEAAVDDVRIVHTP